MKVSRQLEEDTVLFADLGAGECFLYGGVVWIKADMGKTANAVTLNLGGPGLFKGYDKVRHLPNAKVVY